MTLIKREDAKEAVACELHYKLGMDIEMAKGVASVIDALPSAETKWIPCNKQMSLVMMPDELVAVNVTWVNHLAPPYYKHIEDVPFVDTAVYYKGAWYWWDATVIDLLGEYDGAYIHGIEPIDKDIEITAWMPLPKPWKGARHDV